jgi:hypothetical protein
VSPSQLTDHRVHTEWQRSISGVHSFMMEKLAQAGEGGGCTPILLPSILPSRTNLQCMLQLRGQIHSPYFISTPMCSVPAYKYDLPSYASPIVFANHSARYHPRSAISHPHSARSHSQPANIYLHKFSLFRIFGERSDARQRTRHGKRPGAARQGEERGHAAKSKYFQVG